MSTDTGRESGVVAGRKKSTLIAVLVTAALLFILIAGFMYRTFAVLTSGNPIGVLLGVSLAVLAAIGLWATIREIMFGAQSARLMRILEDEGAQLQAEIELTPAGRPDRAQARAALPELESRAAANPQNWREQMWLGIVRRAAGDNQGARRAVRQAIALAKQHP